MVLAQAVDLNVAHNDHAVVVVPLVVPDGLVDDLARRLLVPLGQEQQRLGVPRRRVQEARPRRVLADALEDRAHRAAHLLQALRVGSRVRLLCVAGCDASQPQAK